MHRLTLTALLGFLLGVVFCEKYLFSTEVAVALFLVGVVSYVIVFLKRNNDHTTFLNTPKRSLLGRYGIALYIGIVCLSFVLGVIRVQFVEPKPIFVCEKTCTFTAHVVTSPETKDAYQVFAVLPDDEVDTDMLSVQVKTPLYPQVSMGDKLTLTGKVTVPKSSMPHGEVQSFNYGAYLALYSIGSEMYYPHMEIMSDGNTKSFSIRLVEMKELYSSRISLYIDTPASTLASGMLFGDSSMSRELTQTFRTAGLSHIVVLSGFNIAILISFVLFVYMFLPLVIRIIVSTVFVIFFVMMVGAEVSVIRATIMSLVALTALLLGRAYTARQALLLSLFIIILYEPAHLLSDVSLHLSFLATAGIIYLSDELSNIFKRIRRESYREIVVTTCAAYMATLPYIMYTFGTVSLYALVANMIVLPLVPIVMLVTFFVVVSAPVSSLLGTIFGYVCTVLGASIIFIARTIESLPYASLGVSISFSTMLLIYMIGAIIFYWYSTREKNETCETKQEEILSEVITY